MKRFASFSPYLLCLSVLIFDGRAFAAPHVLKTYDGASHKHQFRDIEAVPAGGYIAVGTSWTADNCCPKVWLVRLDANAGVLWEKRFNTASNADAHGNAVATTGDGGFIVAATVGSEAWIAKLDAQGEPEWQKTYGVTNWEGATDIVELGDGGFVFVGSMTAGFGSDYRTVRLDPLGNIVWQRGLDLLESDLAQRVIATHDGRILVVGSGSSISDPENWVFTGELLSYSASGQLLAQRGFAQFEHPLDIDELPDGGFIVTTSKFPDNESGRTGWHRLDANLAPVWDRSYGIPGIGVDFHASIAMPDGGVLTAGSAGASPSHPWLARLDAAGGILWTHQYSIASGHFLKPLLTADGIVAAGYFDSPQSRTTALIGTLSSEGEFAPACGLVQDLPLQSAAVASPYAAAGAPRAIALTGVTTTAAAVATSVTVATPCDDPDPDGDGWEVAQDNCPANFNPSQSDGDNDGIGDACDGDDGLILFTDLTDTSFAWQTDPAFATYNLYRGSLAALRTTGEYTQSPGANDCASRSCSLSAAASDDAFVPTPGTSCFYLVSGNGSTGESDLDDPTGPPRPNHNPCP